MARGLLWWVAMKTNKNLKPLRAADLRKVQGGGVLFVEVFSNPIYEQATVFSNPVYKAQDINPTPHSE